MSPARDQPAFLTAPPAAELVAALLDAAAVCRRIRADARFQTKGDASPVTVADFAVQAVVARRLAAAVPGLTLVAEEDSHSLRGDAGGDMLADVLDQVRQSTPQATADDVCEWIDLGGGDPGADFWTLDPVDGTKGFRRGRQFAVALARIRHGEIVLAGLACPALALAVETLSARPGVVAVAARGEGAWARAIHGGPWARLRVSQVKAASDSRGLRSVEGAHTDEAWLGRLLTALQVERPLERMDSQAKALVVAAGQADWIFRLVPASNRAHREWIWDQAAGSLVVEEAGGRVTDLEGGRLDFGAGRRLERNLGALTTNGLLHDAALAALRDTFPR
jgi:3'(2'), 5'-bisphosphate nucleotidase